MTPREYAFLCRRCGATDDPESNRAVYCTRCASITAGAIVRRFMAGEGVPTLAQSLGISRARVERVLAQRNIRRADYPRHAVPPEGHQMAQDEREESPPSPARPSGTIDDAFARGVIVIGNHTYTEHLGSEGRISYACDAYGDVWRLEQGRKREWHGRRSNWPASRAARRIASPRTLPSDWDRQEVQRRLEGERL